MNFKKFLPLAISFVTNKAEPARVMVQCRTLVDKSAVTRKTIDGVEHVIITSKTLPDNIVMNGGLYPVDEVNKSFKSLERTLAPVEHPKVGDQYISANDPVAINSFYAGAYNQNVRREGGTILIDKVINVAEAMKSERGKRLLDRINELETNANPRPIHTSVGVFLQREELPEMQVNAAGQEYTWIARNMVFDHDAILLDSVAAAQPHQGVGMAVNSKGDKFSVESVEYTSTKKDKKMKVNADGMTHSDIRDALCRAICQPPYDGDWVVDVYDSTFVFASDEQYFSVAYEISDGQAKIVGIPQEVERSVTYVPVTNHQQEVDPMKEVIVNALKKAGIEVNGLSDEALLSEYNKLTLKANQTDDTSAKPTTDSKASDASVADSLAAIAKRLDGLEGKFNSADELKVNELANTVVNSGKYPGVTLDDAKKLSVNALTSMAAACTPAFGIPLTVVNSTGNSGDANKPVEMPE